MLVCVCTVGYLRDAHVSMAPHPCDQLNTKVADVTSLPKCWLNAVYLYTRVPNVWLSPTPPGCELAFHVFVARVGVWADLYTLCWWLIGSKGIASIKTKREGETFFKGVRFSKLSVSAFNPFFFILLIWGGEQENWLRWPNPLVALPLMVTIVTCSGKTGNKSEGLVSEINVPYLFMQPTMNGRASCDWHSVILHVHHYNTSSMSLTNWK